MNYKSFITSHQIAFTYFTWDSFIGSFFTDCRKKDLNACLFIIGDSFCIAYRKIERRSRSTGFVVEFQEYSKFHSAILKPFWKLALGAENQAFTPRRIFCLTCGSMCSIYLFTSASRFFPSSCRSISYLGMWRD